jgi:amino acid efflux transporter
MFSPPRGRIRQRAPCSRSDGSLVGGNDGRHRLGVVSGAALYVGAVLGPGVLLLPGLAASTAGPASALAWIGLVLLSVPLAATFAALGVRHPVAGGVAAYARIALGPVAGAATGWWFFASVVIGAPTVCLIGGLYVAELVHGGRWVEVASAAGMLAIVIVANRLGFRASISLQLGLTAALAAVLVIAVATALPSGASDAWAPFAPHGWLAVGTAANLLIFSFVGWEAGSSLVGEFGEPRRQLPRAMAIAFGAIAVLYLGLAAATISVLGGASSPVPLADLMETGLGHGGRTATAIVAALLTTGCVNAYVAAATSLATALASDGSMPGWLLGPSGARTWRPLGVIVVVSPVMLALLAVGLGDVGALVRAISACFVAVYLTGTAAGARLLDGKARRAAQLAFVLVLVVFAFSGVYMIVPAVIALAAAWFVRRTRGAREKARSAARQQGREARLQPVRGADDLAAGGH